MSGILTAFSGGAFTELVINITNTVRPDIVALVNAAGWLGPVQPIRIVSTGLVNTLDIPAGALSGSDITLDLSSASFIGGTYNGGTAALKTRVPIKVSNLGTLAGGGGAGGYGATAWVRFSAPDFVPASGWGYYGAPGRGQGFAADSLQVLPATSGEAGTNSGTVYGYQAGGGGGFGGGVANAQAQGGTGGAGGNWGQNGNTGGGSSTTSTGTAGKSYEHAEYPYGADGQSAGYYIDGNSYVTWLATGTRLGRAT